MSDAAATRASATRQAEHQTALTSLREFGIPLAAPDPVLVIDARLAAMVEVYCTTNRGPDVATAFRDSAAALLRARGESVGIYGGTP